VTRDPQRQLRIPRLYAILDFDVAARAGWSLDDLARASLAGGVEILQVRAKHLSSAAFLSIVAGIVELAHREGARVIANDRADIARLAGADGVHVGQDDLAPTQVRDIVGEAAIVGLSTHSTEEIEQGREEPVDYLAIGPVFATVTKAAAHAPIGLETVRYARQLVEGSGRELIAIGGITLDNAREVLEAGATAVAVISDLLAGGDPRRRVQAFLDRLTV
jgi:thiamine-phosphate pyrophosphorylase